MKDGKISDRNDLVCRLTIAFALLKLTGVVNWSWLWVFSPILTVFFCDVIMAVIIVVVSAAVALIERAERRAKKDLRAANLDAQAARFGLERQPGESDVELKRRIAFMKQAARRANHDQ